MYEAFYGLTGKPFQLNPDPAFYFGSRGHKRAFAYLQYGLYQSEGFIVITGEIGAGKTTIVRSLFEQIDRDKLVAAQLVSTQLDADDMLRAVGAAFGLPVRAVGKAVLLASLEAFLCQTALDKKRALLVVDEAQNLTPKAIEELRMLSNFQLGDQALLQSFLIGQPELRKMMQSPQMQQLRQRVIASYHLGPLDRAETQAYIEHRLHHVGWNEDPRFELACFDLIHTWSGGIPRRINTLCNRLMLAVFLGEKHGIGSNGCSPPRSICCIAHCSKNSARRSRALRSSDDRLGFERPRSSPLCCRRAPQLHEDGAAGACVRCAPGLATRVPRPHGATLR